MFLPFKIKNKNIFNKKKKELNNIKLIVQEEFDANFYIEENPEVRVKNIDPLEHYITVGWREGCDPSPSFSTSHYLKNNPDVRAADINPLYHYIIFGRKEGRTPLPTESEQLLLTDRTLEEIKYIISREFDVEFYLDQYPDIRDNNLDPIDHYIAFGWGEGRDPSPLFSTSYYLNSNPEVRAANINPFYHYLVWGRNAGRAPYTAGSMKRAIRVNRDAELVTDRALADLTRYETRSLKARSKFYDRKSLDVHWVVPDFLAGGGGHMTIFRIIRLLEFFGHNCVVWINNPVFHEDPQVAYDDIIKHYQTIKADVRFVSQELFNASGDVIIATSWDTVFPVMHTIAFKERFYFVQDFEPSFHPHGAYSIAAELTYQQDIACICASPWLEKLMRERYGRWARHFWLAYDEQVYKPLNECSVPNDIPRIAFYSRATTARRAVELGLLALQELARRGVSFHVDFFGSDLDIVEAPFPCRDHGVLDGCQLAELYTSADIGIVFSTTNYSLVPQEMMACGLPVVEFDTDSTRAVYPDDVVTFAGPGPFDIADNIERLIRDPKRRLKQAQAARLWVSQFTWEASARDVETALVERLELCGYSRRRRARRRSLSRSKPKASVFIPTYNGGKVFERVLDAVRNQRTPWCFEIVVIDSSSNDGTAELCRDADDILFEQIERSRFGHGPTRNHAVEMSSGEFIAFLTQDALPVDEYWLYNLVSLLEHFPNAAGAFGRHLAWPDATPFTKRDISNHFARFDEFPLAMSKETDFERWEAGDIQWRQMLHYYSDNNSCLRRSVWETIPYPDVDWGEDQIWANQIIEAGYQKVYARSAVVYHSHDYDYDETFNRSRIESRFFKKYFDYTLVSDIENADALIEGLNRRDKWWAVRHDVDISAIKFQKTLNEAKILGYIAGMADP